MLSPYLFECNAGAINMGFREPRLDHLEVTRGISSTSVKNGRPRSLGYVVSALDFLPTFCELAGAELPDVELDGESFVSLLETGEFNRKKPLIWAFYDAINEHRVAMRKGDWKIMARLEADNKELPHIHNLARSNEALVKRAELTDFVLFNLKEDIRESENLATKEIEVFEVMKKEFITEYEKLLDESHIWVRAEE